MTKRKIKPLDEIPTPEEPQAAFAGEDSITQPRDSRPSTADEDVLPAEQVEAMERELEEARAKAEEYLGGWQRTLAEFANYKKRIEREQSLVYQNAIGSVVKRYLEILDDLERALKNRPPFGDGAAWAEGIELVYRKFLAALEAEGVKMMDAESQFFDPNFHEAISQEQSDRHQSGQIIGVVQPGYLLGERVLRPARVRVAR